jgi:transcriptional regulator
MYVHPAFKVDPAALEGLLVERGFGTLVAFDGTKPVGVHVPFLLDAARGEIELHVARVNPIHTIIARNPVVLLTCMGPDAYISPDWYESENQVPTWNYVAAHVTGTAELMPAEALRGHVDRLSARFENALPKTPWTSDKMDPRRLAAMLNAIVGIIVKIESLEGQWKLGQHKGRGDHDGAVTSLRARQDRPPWPTSWMRPAGSSVDRALALRTGRPPWCGQSSVGLRPCGSLACIHAFWGSSAPI